jgi:hypothetical protein
MNFLFDVNLRFLLNLVSFFSPLFLGIGELS